MGVERKGMKNKISRSKDLGGWVGKKRQKIYDNSLSPNRIRSKWLLDRARRYRSPMKSLESSSSMFESRTRHCLHSESYCSFCKEYENHVCVDEVDRDVPIPPWSFVIPDEDGDAMTINIPSDVNKGNLQILDHVKCVGVAKVNALLTMVVGLQNILVTKILKSRDRLNSSNNIIHQLRRRLVDISYLIS
ncbi:uncharacterized protein LOC133791611 [Humulus lupulus]|uniref:uncharacterized protein LOC133791611 n=1 Tax=Humulus lupulus TaxID=3486 RepID=UPI002B400F4B|nr:uncharacterized protein LOC133791611 [Humulus lupulus]